MGHNDTARKSKPGKKLLPCEISASAGGIHKIQKNFKVGTEYAYCLM